MDIFPVWKQALEIKNEYNNYNKQVFMNEEW